MEFNLKNLIRGQAEKKIHGYYLIGIFLYFIVFIGVSILLFSGGTWGGATYGSFNPWYICISNVGDHLLNPRGWIFFSIATIGEGILLIPHVRYIYSHIHPEAPKSGVLFLLFLCVSVIGFAGIGIISEDTIFPVHYFFGGLVFGGFGVAAIYSFFFLLLQIVRRKPWPTIKQFVILCAIVLAATAYLLYTIALSNTNIPHSISLAEWVMLPTLMGWSVGLFLMMPDKK